MVAVLVTLAKEGREVNCEQITRERRDAATLLVKLLAWPHEFRLTTTRARRDRRRFAALKERIVLILS